MSLCPVWFDLGVSVSDGLSREELISLAREQDARIVELTVANEALAVRLARVEHLLSRNSSNSSSPPSKDDDPGRAPPVAKKKRDISAGARGRQRGAPGSCLAWSDAPDRQRGPVPGRLVRVRSAVGRRAGSGCGGPVSAGRGLVDDRDADPV